MLCTPWQLAQLATVCEPLLAARPWKDESKLTSRSLGMPNFRVRRTSPWQLPQVSRMCADIHRTGGVGVLEDLVLAMAIGAQRRLGDAACQRLAVHAGAELIHHLGVAHAAGVGNRRAEGLGFRREQFVGAAVAEGAIGRAFVSALARLAVDPLIVIAGLIGVAGDANRFGDIRGVRDFVVRFVAGIAGERCVRALGQLLPLLVAGGAFGSGVAGGVKVRAGGAGKQA